MRIILFTGKGGVGKTTTAAATAVSAARSGIKTLVMSTDAAHSLGDALGVGAGAGEAVAEVEPGLWALQVGASGGLRRSWGSVQDYLLGILGAVGIDPVVADEITSLPGAQEIFALLELREQAASGPWDLVVLDCAPTAETLRLLALPEVLAWHLERLMPAQRGLLRSLRPAAAAAAGLPLPGADVLAAVTGWYQRMRDVRSLLTAPTTSVRLVLTPERVVIAETRRTLTQLYLHGFTVDAVVVNRVFPDAAQDADGRPAPDSDPWRSGWNAAQRKGLAEVEESFAPLPVLRSPYLAAEPVGADALAALAAAQTVRGPAAPDLLAPVEQRQPRVEASGSGFTLTMPLPLVAAAEVDLKRRGEELLIEVGGHRRVVSLPSVLQCCLVTGASVHDGQLSVRFVRDEQQWPSGGRHG